MIEKVGHIRNPLTVIAMFAALAEVGGTVVLPLIDKDVQGTFVWFLMLFPALLVLSFFGTLLWKPQSLYAPSDYKDEMIFRGFFQASTPAERREKLESEVEDDLKAGGALTAANNDTPTIVDGSSNVPTDNKKNEKPLASAPAPKRAEVVTPETAEVINTRENARKIYRDAIIAEDGLINLIATQRKLAFLRNVAPSAHAGIQFDAVAVEGLAITVVEVKFITAGVISYSIVERTLNSVARFFDTLNSEQRRKFKFIFGVVVDGPASDRIDEIGDRIAEAGTRRPFPVDYEIRLFSDVAVAAT